ncbi:hypothetical protein DICPUDRAFT_151430 [Dictyostelium purpureum]|uniref:Uncharacterized protein n=1 Tax=Dictyostelium purpureum TaxID=5786 RepID=F0ZIT7_DICPU|nr:uncharacterized protein DICPUDRAFT_151430 [Dictyostelium purpureum]EGC36133.1 hypothetical protein DICPUDRAFT_151430 [Dictyostelium purpureum]|eukprot:XP_003287326.1 hypothetical protein DICPUDRAFT_151430 [Dictyostelium purpureum]
MLIVFGISSILAEEIDCTHAVCPGNFECPREYSFYKYPGVCCYDCVLDCNSVVCPKKLTCKGDGNHIVKAGNRFCCDHCYY